MKSTVFPYRDDLADSCTYFNRPSSRDMVKGHSKPVYKPDSSTGGYGHRQETKHHLPNPHIKCSPFSMANKKAAIVNHNQKS